MSQTVWKPQPTVLQGQHVRLEPLATTHVAGLLAASNESRQTYGLTFVPQDAASMEAYVVAACEVAQAGLSAPFATLEASTGRVIGSTRFANFEFLPWPAGSPNAPKNGAPDAVEIGWTWLAQSAQRSGANTEAKLLMLRHAFAVWGVRCLRLKTDSRNQRSRDAIVRLGATFDGVLRHHMAAADGAVRHSAYYSILAEEWPKLEADLQRRLAAHRP